MTYDSLQLAYSTYQTGMLLSGLPARGSHFVGGEGSWDAPVMLVGEAPGEQEDRDRRPFAGRSGQLLDELLRSAGLRRGFTFVTNVVKYRPVNFAGRNRSPYPHEIAASLACLREEIGFVEPAVIVTLGSVAMHALVPGAGTMEEEHGKVKRPGDQWILQLYHPSACLRDPEIRRKTFEDIKWLHGITCE
jgi:DNA polymerase